MEDADLESEAHQQAVRDRWERQAAEEKEWGIPAGKGEYTEVWGGDGVPPRPEAADWVIFSLGTIPDAGE